MTKENEERQERRCMYCGDPYPVNKQRKEYDGFYGHPECRLRFKQEVETAMNNQIKGSSELLEKLRQQVMIDVGLRQPEECVEGALCRELQNQIVETQQEFERELGDSWTHIAAHRIIDSILSTNHKTLPEYVEGCETCKRNKEHYPRRLNECKLHGHRVRLAKIKNRLHRGDWII